MDIIKICGLTKDYGKGKGIFDIDITVRKGEVYGYLGPNGAGKSTTLLPSYGIYEASVGYGKHRGNGLLEAAEEDTGEGRIFAGRDSLSR